MPLTELTIKNLKPKQKAYRIADSGGLCLEITPNGSKLWRLRYRYQGKEQLLALGKYPIIPLSEARTLRDKAKLEVQSGKHLTREKKANKLRQSFEGDQTFEKVARSWHETKQAKLDRKYRTQNLARLEQRVFPYIGDLPITEISIPTIVEVVERIAKGSVAQGKKQKGGKPRTETVETANRVKQMIARIFRYATQRGLCTFNPAADLRDILPSRKKKHYNCISQKEFPVLIKKIDGLKKELGRLAMQFVALTFVRTSELTGAQWQEIDWARSEWNIPGQRMKMGRPHKVPLSKQAIAILKQLQTKTGKTPYIFYSNSSKTKHVSNTILLMSLKRLGYEGKMTGHGFRTLASTILNEHGYDDDVIEKQLAHEDEDKIRAAYNRAEYLPERKKMMQDYADIIDSLRKGKTFKEMIVIKQSIAQ